MLFLKSSMNLRWVQIFFWQKYPGQKNMSPLEIWCNESQERYVLYYQKISMMSLKHVQGKIVQLQI